MNWQDKGYLLSLNKYNENSSIAEFYTENNGKIVGVIFGSTSKKIKSYLLIGNKFHINSKLREDGRLVVSILIVLSFQSHKQSSSFVIMV